MDCNDESVFKRIFSYDAACSFDEVIKIDQTLGSPWKSYQTIHIAGTNGKGSVATKIAAALTKAGYKCGLTTSPHLFDPCERISIDGVYISKERLVPLITSLEGKIPHFFGLITAAAFEYFQQERVDFAVIETGKGGRFDYTNVICPVVCAITSISLDHTESLGSTLEKIAYQKAGIIKKNVPVVLGPKARQPIFFETAKAFESPLILAEENSDDYYLENAQIARKVLELLCVDEEAISYGLTIQQPLRCQKIFYKEKTLILDVAHNPDGFFHLFSKCESLPLERPIALLTAISKDKDHELMIRIAKNYVDEVHFLGIDHPRLLKTGSEMALKDLLYYLEATSCRSLIVAGSFSIFAPLLQLLSGTKGCDFSGFLNSDYRLIKLF